jgi:hypothetical protein
MGKIDIIKSHPDMLLWLTMSSGAHLASFYIFGRPHSSYEPKSGLAGDSSLQS